MLLALKTFNRILTRLFMLIVHTKILPLLGFKRFEEKVITPELITDILQKKYPGVNVSGITQKTLDSGTTTRNQLQIQYEDGHNYKNLPHTMFIKTTPPAIATALFGFLFKLGHSEVLFYKHAAEQAPVEKPDFYYGQSRAYGFILLLEDLADKQWRFTDVSSKCSPDDAELVMDSLATLHAAFRQSERFQTDLSWVGCYENDENRFLQHWLRKMSVKQALKKYGDVVPDEVHHNAALILNHYDTLESLWAQEPRTLLHGDPHIGNMYFSDNTVGLLDWQVVWRGQGMRDVSYFLINSLPTDLRLKHQDELINHYLKTLNTHGVETLDFNTAWEQYRLFSIYAWIATVVTAAAGNLQEPKIAKAGLSRTCKALVDLEVFSLIEEKCRNRNEPN